MRVGMEPSKTSWLAYLVLVVWVMEGSGLGGGGCVVHVDVHAWRVSCIVNCYNAIATEPGADSGGAWRTNAPPPPPPPPFRSEPMQRRRLCRHKTLKTAASERQFCGSCHKVALWQCLGYTRGCSERKDGLCEYALSTHTS